MFKLVSLAFGASVLLGGTALAQTSPSAHGPFDTSSGGSAAAPQGTPSAPLNVTCVSGCSGGSGSAGSIGAAGVNGTTAQSIQGITGGVAVPVSGAAGSLTAAGTGGTVAQAVQGIAGGVAQPVVISSGAATIGGVFMTISAAPISVNGTTSATAGVSSTFVAASTMTRGFVLQNTCATAEWFSVSLAAGTALTATNSMTLAPGATFFSPDWFAISSPVIVASATAAACTYSGFYK